MQDAKRSLSVRLSTAATVLLLVGMIVAVSGCDLIVGIFQVGVWAGVIMLLLAIALVAFLVRLITRRRV